LDFFFRYSPIPSHPEHPEVDEGNVVDGNDPEVDGKEESDEMMRHNLILGGSGVPPPQLPPHNQRVYQYTGPPSIQVNSFKNGRILNASKTIKKVKRGGVNTKLRLVKLWSVIQLKPLFLNTTSCELLNIKKKF